MHRYEFTKYPLDVRRSKMKFHCDCIACEKEYPMNNLPSSSVAPPSTIPSWPGLSNNRPKFIADEQEIREYIQQQFHEFPTKELVLANDYYHFICEQRYCKEVSLYFRFVMDDGGSHSISISIHRLLINHMK